MNALIGFLIALAVGITGIEKYSASAESAYGPRMFAKRSTHTATSGRLRAKPRTYDSTSPLNTGCRPESTRYSVSCVRDS